MVVAVLLMQVVLFHIPILLKTLSCFLSYLLPVPGKQSIDLVFMAGRIDIYVNSDYINCYSMFCPILTF